jgi:hypothetical protein
MTDFQVSKSKLEKCIRKKHAILRKASAYKSLKKKVINTSFATQIQPILFIADRPVTKWLSGWLYSKLPVAYWP